MSANKHMYTAQRVWGDISVNQGREVYVIAAALEETERSEREQHDRIVAAFERIADAMERLADQQVAP